MSRNQFLETSQRTSVTDLGSVVSEYQKPSRAKNRTASFRQRAFPSVFFQAWCTVSYPCLQADKPPRKEQAEKICASLYSERFRSKQSPRSGAEASYLRGRFLRLQWPGTLHSQICMPQLRTLYCVLYRLMSGLRLYFRNRSQNLSSKARLSSASGLLNLERREESKSGIALDERACFMSTGMKRFRSNL